MLKIRAKINENKNKEMRTLKKLKDDFLKRSE